MGEFLSRRETYRQAKACLKKGDSDAAAKVFANNNLAFEGGRFFAQISKLSNEGRFPVASALFTHANREAEGAEILRRAGERFSKSGKTASAKYAYGCASDLYDRSGNYEKAGIYSLKAGTAPQYAFHLFKCGNAHQEGAKILRKYGHDDLANILLEIKEHQNATITEAKKHLTAGKPGLASKLFIENKIPFEGGEYLLKMGHAEKAAALFVKAGREADGARLLENHGRQRLAEYLRSLDEEKRKRKPGSCGLG